jgi:hypothetical protein
VGTLPGIPLIISFYLVISSIRKRAFKEDSQQIRDVYEDESNVEKTVAILDHEFETVLSNLESFTENLSQNNQNDLISMIDLQIQRLRAFLICSEQFESQVVRDFYRFAVNRLEGGKSTRTSLLGDHFFVLDGKLDSPMLFSQLGEVLQFRPTEITLLRVDDFTVEIAVIDPDRFTSMVNELVSKFPQVKIVIKSLN